MSDRDRSRGDEPEIVCFFTVAEVAQQMSRHCVNMCVQTEKEPPIGVYKGTEVRTKTCKFHRGEEREGQSINTLLCIVVRRKHSTSSGSRTTNTSRQRTDKRHESRKRTTSTNADVRQLQGKKKTTNSWKADRSGGSRAACRWEERGLGTTERRGGRGRAIGVGVPTCRRGVSQDREEVESEEREEEEEE